MIHTASVCPVSVIGLLWLPSVSFKGLLWLASVSFIGSLWLTSVSFKGLLWLTSVSFLLSRILLVTEVASEKNRNNLT